MRLAIVGTGEMAYGIARLCLQSQISPLIVGRSSQKLTTLRARLTTQINSFNKNNLLATSQNVVDLSGMDVVMEVVSEDFSTKAKVLKLIEENVSDQAIITTCTSSLSINDLATCLTHPSRFCGLHFSNPPWILRIAELIKCRTTTPQLETQIKDLCGRLQVQAFIVPDTPGFVLNAILFSLVLQAIMTKKRTNLDWQTIDDIMKKGAGMPMGPSELISMIGADVSKQIVENLISLYMREITTLSTGLDELFQNNFRN